MKEIRWLLKYIKYGWLLNYHLKKKNKFDSKHQTVLKYHFEMAEHYYKKIFEDK
jgi:hypothetical protein